MHANDPLSAAIAHLEQRVTEEPEQNGYQSAINDLREFAAALPADAPLRGRALRADGDDWLLTPQDLRQVAGLIESNGTAGIVPAYLVRALIRFAEWQEGESPRGREAGGLVGHRKGCEAGSCGYCGEAIGSCANDCRDRGRIIACSCQRLALDDALSFLDSDFALKLRVVDAAIAALTAEPPRQETKRHDFTPIKADNTRCAVCGYSDLLHNQPAPSGRGETP